MVSAPKRRTASQGKTLSLIHICLLAGYRRGAWEFCLMRLADVFQSFPSIVLVLCLVSLVGPSALNLVLVLGLLGWTGIARLVYGNTLSVREKEYVLAARALSLIHI